MSSVHPSNYALVDNSLLLGPPHSDVKADSLRMTEVNKLVTVPADMTAFDAFMKMHQVPPSLPSPRANLQFIHGLITRTGESLFARSRVWQWRDLRKPLCY
jgi:hypothetical protein